MKSLQMVKLSLKSVSLCFLSPIPLQENPRGENLIRNHSNGWEWIEMDGIGWEWIGMDANESEWIGNGSDWIGNGWECLSKDGGA